MNFIHQSRYAAHQFGSAARAGSSRMLHLSMVILASDWGKDIQRMASNRASNCGFEAPNRGLPGLNRSENKAAHQTARRRKRRCETRGKLRESAGTIATILRARHSSARSGMQLLQPPTAAEWRQSSAMRTSTASRRSIRALPTFEANVVQPLSSSDSLA